MAEVERSKMKYKIIKDSDILEGFSDKEVAEKMKKDKSYINRLRNGRRIATEEFLEQLKSTLLTK